MNTFQFGLCESCCTPSVYSSCSIFDITNNLTLIFTPCTPAPANDYWVRYRLAGSSDPYTTEGPFTTSPISIPTLDAVGTQYEGSLFSDCGNGNITEVPFDTRDDNFTFDSTLAGITTTSVSGLPAGLVTTPAIGIFSQQSHHSGFSARTITGNYSGTPVIAGKISIEVDGVTVDCQNIPVASGGSWSLTFPDDVSPCAIIRLSYDTGSC